MRRLAAVAVFLAPALLPAVTPAGAQRLPNPTLCGVTVPADEAGRFVPLPVGDVFCPIVADPKGIRSFVSILGETSDAPETRVGSVGIGDSFGMFRWGGDRVGDGLQVSLAGSVFAQFDLDAASYDLLNADFIIALPLTYRRDGFSARARVYHQSSHLGDEFLLRGDHPERENLSYESAELVLSQDVGMLRLYGGGEYLFNRSPDDLASTVAQGGFELRPGGGVDFGRFGRVRPLAALDVKTSREQDWDPAWSARAGLDFGRPREGEEAVAGRWSLLAEYYSGPSPYGQFYRNEVTFVGVGLHFTIR